MPRPPAISVVVTTFGRPAFLAEALESVARQTMADFECIVVDDASPTPVALPIADLRFRLIRREQNGGAGAARNTGLRAATGAGVVFLDDDDVFTPDRLTIAADLLKRAPIGLCGSGRVGSTAVSVPSLEGEVGDRILDATTPHLGTTTVRRAACVEFDESYRTCEDLDWWLRMARVGPVAADPRIGWLWRSHTGERGDSGTAARLADSRKLLADHHAYFSDHRRAAAFRWRRIAILAAQSGQTRTRWAASMRAMWFDPRPSAVVRRKDGGAPKGPSPDTLIRRDLGGGHYGRHPCDAGWSTNSVNLLQ